MTEIQQKRRGRPTLPEDNATREAILSAGQKLFAIRNFNQVTVREITELAQVNTAAVNYHFGNKEGLIRALFKRLAPTLIARRKALLKEALEGFGESTGSDGIDDVDARLRKVLFALLMPVMEWSVQPDTQHYTLPFIKRMRLDGPEDIRQQSETDTRHLKPFVKALHQLLPQLPDTEIYWRLHFVLGIEHALHMEAQRLFSLSGGRCRVDDAEAAVARVIDFCLPGLLGVGR